MNDQEKKSRGQRRRRPARAGEEGGGEKEFEQEIIDLARVTRVMAGGKRMRFRACVVIGDKKGRVGLGVAKGQDVSMAIAKASAQARKNIIVVPLIDKRTLNHEVLVKYKSAQVFLKPAKAGTGLKAGGALRKVLELVGVVDIVSKMYGSNNKINNVQAVFAALSQILPRKQ